VKLWMLLLLLMLLEKVGLCEHLLRWRRRDKTWEGLLLLREHVVEEKGVQIHHVLQSLHLWIRHLILL
jgi:hypothetical protein